MAISIVNGNRGTATEKTSDQTLTLTPNANLAAGNYALLAVVIDNTGTAEGQTTDISVTDNGPSATWQRLREQTEANTTALTGVTAALFLARLPYALTTAHTISIAIAANSTAKGAGLAELSVAAGSELVESASGDNGANAAAATSYSVALSGLTNVAGLYVGVAAAEEELDTAVTLDAAYTALGFGSIGSGTGGANTTNVRARVGTLANTSTGDTFNAAALTSADRATILVRLEEYTPPFIADPVFVALAADLADAEYHRQSERRNSSGFMRVPVVGQPPPFIAEPVSVALAADLVDATNHLQTRRRNRSSLRPPDVVLSPEERPVIRVRLAVDSSLRVAISQATNSRIFSPSVVFAIAERPYVQGGLFSLRDVKRQPATSFVAPPVVIGSAQEEAISDRIAVSSAALGMATLVASTVTFTGYTKVPIVEVPPPPPEPPQIPTSPPPFRLGGGSAW